MEQLSNLSYKECKAMVIKVLMRLKKRLDYLRKPTMRQKI